VFAWWNQSRQSAFVEWFLVRYNGTVFPEFQHFGISEHGRTAKKRAVKGYKYTQALCAWLTRFLEYLQLELRLRRRYVRMPLGVELDPH